MSTHLTPLHWVNKLLTAPNSKGTLTCCNYFKYLQSSVKRVNGSVTASETPVVGIQRDYTEQQSAILYFETVNTFQTSLLANFPWKSLWDGYQSRGVGLRCVYQSWSLRRKRKRTLNIAKAGTPESSRRTLYLDIQIQENQMGTKKPLDMYIAGCLCGSTRCSLFPFKYSFIWIYLCSHMNLVLLTN